MALRIVTADERLSRAANKTTVALFGQSGVGKTSLLNTLPEAETLCIDLEAGMKSVQGWRGDSVPVRCFADALDIACLVGGPDPAAAPEGIFTPRRTTTTSAKPIRTSRGWSPASRPSSWTASPT